jgi:hypothetical protein
MESYKKYLEKIAEEIVSETKTKKEYPNYEPVLDRYLISESVSKIYGMDLMKVTVDLDDEIKKATRRK